MIGPVIAEYDYQYPDRQPIRLIFYSVTDFKGEVENGVFAQIRWEKRQQLPEYDFLEGDVDFVRALVANRQREGSFGCLTWGFGWRFGLSGGS